MPAALMSLAYFAASVRVNSVNSSGVLATGSIYLIADLLRDDRGPGSTL